MDITPLIAADAKVIQSVRDGEVKVNGEWHPLPLIVTPGKLIPWDGIDWSLLQGDVILMGTGTQFLFPDKQQRDAAKAQNKAMEWMDNAAVARSYNVLMSEGRIIIAALL